VGLAALTLLVPSAPTTDPWGWILWGREVANLELSTELRGSPAWKPLPVFLTTPLSLTGELAPTLWILVSRSFGLAGLLLAFLLAGRLAGDAGPWLRWAAGAIAVVGIVLSRDWLRGFLHGYSEPLTLALLLAAVERHLSAHRAQALFLGAAVAAGRPEAFPLVIGYGALLLWRRELRLAPVAAAVAAVPAVWLIPDWIGSGDPFHGGRLASELMDRKGTLEFVFRIIPVPLFFAAIAGTALALWRRDRAFVEVAGVGFAWYAALGLMMAFGYTIASRFFYLPAELLCVVGAAAVVRLVTLPRPAWIRAPLAAAALGVLALSAVPRAEDSVTVAERASTVAQIERDLWHAVTRAGGADLSRCGRAAFPGGYRWMKGVVGWRLGLPLREIDTFRAPGSRYIAGLHAEGLVHRLERGGTVRIVVPPEPSVMFLPYVGMRIELAPRRRSPQLERLASYGQWLVATSDPAGCRARLAGEAG
jgi:hypothetical protein